MKSDFSHWLDINTLQAYKLSSNQPQIPTPTIEISNDTRKCKLTNGIHCTRRDLARDANFDLKQDKDRFCEHSETRNYTFIDAAMSI